MKKLTPLSAFSILYILAIATYTLINWSVLMDSEGWGVVGMAILTSAGFFGLIIDFILRLIIRNKMLFNAIEIIIIVIFSYVFYTKIIQNW
jgi:hypothetical protein